MNREAMLESLAAWINGLKESAEADETLSISFFNETEDKPFSIVGGWADGYDERDIDIMCISRSNPTYAMSVKVVVNEGFIESLWLVEISKLVIYELLVIIYTKGVN